jgi:hypothetical protein
MRGDLPFTDLSRIVTEDSALADARRSAINGSSALRSMYDDLRSVRGATETIGDARSVATGLASCQIVDAIASTRIANAGSTSLRTALTFNNETGAGSAASAATAASAAMIEAVRHLYCSEASDRHQAPGTLASAVAATEISTLADIAARTSAAVQMTLAAQKECLSPSAGLVKAIAQSIAAANLGAAAQCASATACTSVASIVAEAAKARTAANVHSAMTSASEHLANLAATDLLVGSRISDLREEVRAVSARAETSIAATLVCRANRAIDDLHATSLHYIASRVSDIALSDPPYDSAATARQMRNFVAHAAARPDLFWDAVDELSGQRFVVSNSMSGIGASRYAYYESIERMGFDFALREPFFRYVSTRVRRAAFERIGAFALRSHAFTWQEFLRVFRDTVETIVYPQSTWRRRVGPSDHAGSTITLRDWVLSFGLRTGCPPPQQAERALCSHALLFMEDYDDHLCFRSALDRGAADRRGRRAVEFRRRQCRDGGRPVARDQIVARPQVHVPHHRADRRLDLGNPRDRRGAHRIQLDRRLRPGQSAPQGMKESHVA